MYTCFLSSIKQFESSFSPTKFLLKIIIHVYGKIRWSLLYNNRAIYKYEMYFLLLLKSLHSFLYKIFTQQRTFPSRSKVLNKRNNKEKYKRKCENCLIVLWKYKYKLQIQDSSRESLGWKLPVHYRHKTFCSFRLTLCASVFTRSENSDCLCIQNICPTPRIERAIYFSVISSSAWKQKYRGVENEWMVGMMRQFISLCKLPMKLPTMRNVPSIDAHAVFRQRANRRR